MSLTALAILKANSNPAIAGKTDDELNVAIQLARPEVSKAAYGGLYQQALAYLVAHDLVMEKQADANSTGAAAGQVLVERQIGKRREKYSGSVGQGQGDVDPRSDEGLQGTSFGKKFMRLRNQVAVGWVTN